MWTLLCLYRIINLKFIKSLKINVNHIEINFLSLAQFLKEEEKKNLRKALFHL